MARRRGIKVRLGDVVEIPIDGSRVGFGQVIAQRFRSFLVVIFETAHARGVQPNPQDIVLDEPAFVAETLDAKSATATGSSSGMSSLITRAYPFPSTKSRLGASTIGK